jgi:hypothetical protein
MKVMFLLGLLIATCWAQPNEELGTMVNMVPKQQASRSPSGEHGFLATVLQQADENNLKPTFVAHSATEFIRLYRRLPVELQENGIWLSLSENDPYSAQEKTMLENLKTLCKKHRLWLFIRTGPGFDDQGWTRVSPTDPTCRQLSGQQLTGKNFERLSPFEKQLIGTWTVADTCLRKNENGQMVQTPISGGVMEITFTSDHREFWCPDGGPSQMSARWRVEGNDLVFTVDNQPKDSPLSKEQRETIAKLTATEIVFTDGTTEVQWTRVQ